MNISARNTITLREVLVGEVWICSGQSNMEWPVARTRNADQEMAGAENPQIRLFRVKRAVSDEPLEDISGKWEIASPESVREFSAVGYFFGREIQQARRTPVGLIASVWGGTPAESWTSEPALRADHNLEPILWQWQRAMAEYPAAKQRYDQQVKDYLEISDLARAGGKKPPARPTPPRGPGDPWTPSLQKQTGSRTPPFPGCAGRGLWGGRRTFGPGL
jgi:sialate O-acetylesterase